MRLGPVQLQPNEFGCKLAAGAAECVPTSFGHEALYRARLCFWNSLCCCCRNTFPPCEVEKNRDGMVESMPTMPHSCLVEVYRVGFRTLCWCFLPCRGGLVAFVNAWDDATNHSFWGGPVLNRFFGFLCQGSVTTNKPLYLAPGSLISAYVAARRLTC